MIRIFVLYETKAIELESILLSVGKYYAIDNKPIFALVNKIFIINNDSFIICTQFNGIFTKGLYSYKLTPRKTGFRFLLDIKRIIDHKSYKTFKHEKNTYISKHNNIFEFKRGI